MSGDDASSDDIRSVAELLIQSSSSHNTRQIYRGPGSSNYIPPHSDLARSHVLDFITEEYLAGYMHDGSMSVVRRFFCLFVTFDLVFVSLLWLICAMVSDNTIAQAFDKEIRHYTISSSVFDLVALAICRFVVLLFFYGLFYINHWFILALSTTGSCVFLVTKVFYLDWAHCNQQTFVVILILISFILAWGEAWYLDCRVIPQERRAGRYFAAIIAQGPETPIVSNFPTTSSINAASIPAQNCPGNFYSPLETAANSDDEEGQDEEYHRRGLDCVRKVHELLVTTDWKLEKVTAQNDTIRSTQKEKLGKIYRLTGHLNYPAKALLMELFYKVEDVPKWSPTLLTSRILHKINAYTDISYQATVNGGGGIIKSRDFVNLRCWRLFRNGQIINETELKEDEDNLLKLSVESNLNASRNNDYSTQTSNANSNRTRMPNSSSSMQLGQREIPTPTNTTEAFRTLSRSLGAKDFNSIINIEPEEPPPLDDVFEDAEDNSDAKASSTEQGPVAKTKTNDNVATTAPDDIAWVSAAESIMDYVKCPPTSKFTRGQNLISGFIFREIKEKPDACIVEWLLCLDLKGYIPRYVLDGAYATFMNEYMTHLRQHIIELRQKRGNVP